MAVCVLDKHQQPLMPCSEKRARLLLERGRARMHRMFPFTIHLADCTGGATQPLALKIDPGSKQTGIAMVREAATTTVTVVALVELKRRGAAIGKALKQRAGYRRSSANLRYRMPRFDNRRRPERWLPPSLQHRVDTVIATVARLRQLAPIASLAQELVRFGMQQMENPEISGVDYRQGTLAGYELREYPLEKWYRICAYGGREDVPLNIDPIHPRSMRGADRASNLTLACIPCNRKKGSNSIEVFLAKDPSRRKRIQPQLKAPLKDAAAVNATRWKLFHALNRTGLSVTTDSGGRTKFNRHRFSVPKTHALNAVCAGNMDTIEAIAGWQQPTFFVRATGRGAYQRTRVTATGFPCGSLMRTKSVHGLQTGDMVKAIVLTGKKAGTYIAGVAVRASGSFNFQTGITVVQDVSYQHRRLLQHNDGYSLPLLEERECASSTA